MVTITVLPKSDPGDDSGMGSDTVSPDMATEVCQLSNHRCRLPLALYDLENLSEILSVTTWNSVLSEDDRFTLAAYLPDMDEEAFSRTLTELFAGHNFHFGSPVERLFDLLKGGKMEPSVEVYRDGARFFKRRKHYMLLREYQERLIGRLVEIRGAYGVKERVKRATVLKASVGPKSDGDFKFAVPKDKPRLPTSHGMREGVGGDEDEFLDEDTDMRRSWSAAHKNVVARANMLKSGKKPEIQIGDEWRKRFPFDDYTGVSNPTKSKLTNPGVTIASYGRGSDDLVPKAQYLERDLNYPVKNEFRHRGEYDMQGGERLKSGMMDVASDSKGRYNKSYLEQIGDAHFRYDPRAKTSGQKIFGQKRERNMEHPRDERVFGRYEEAESELSDQDDPDQSTRKSGYIRDKSAYMVEHHTSRLVDVKVLAKGPENRGRIADSQYFDADLYKGSNMSRKRRPKAERVYGNELDEYAYLQSNQKMQIEHSDRPRKKGKWSSDTQIVSLDDVTPDPFISEKRRINTEREEVPVRTPYTLITPTLYNGFSFSIIHLLSAVRKAMIASQIEDTVESQNHSRNEVQNLPSLTVHEIVNRVRLNPGDPDILVTQEPLHDLVRGVLKIFSSRTAPLGAKGWKALVLYEKSNKSWTWIGPVSSSYSDIDTEETSSEAWGIPHKMLVKLVDAFANWLNSGQEILRQIGSLPAPPISMSQNLDDNERFRDLKTQKCPSTISPSSDESRAYFRKEELLRYSIPDRAFSYTAADGKKSTVAPLRRGGGKPTSKARDHYILKVDRPPHVTILCLVRDAAARLPGSIGTRADISTLIRDSQYIAEDVSDSKINAIVSGALDRLHYERDPCVLFDNDRKLWVYLHRDKEEEDFEDDGTASTKKWKKPRKNTTEQSDAAVLHDVNLPEYGDTELVAYSAEDDFDRDTVGDSTPIYKGHKTEHHHDDSRHNSKIIGSFTDSTTRNRSHEIPVRPQAARSDYLRESTMLCNENSTIEDYDDEPFGRETFGP